MILTLVSPCARQPLRAGELGSTYICELGKLYSSRGHAQIGAYLGRECGTRAPSKYEGVAHRESVLRNVWGKSGSLRKILESANFKFTWGSQPGNVVRAR